MSFLNFYLKYTIYKLFLFLQVYERCGKDYISNMADKKKLQSDYP